MRYHYVGGTILDVNVPSIGLPSWNVSSKFIVGKDNTAIMLLLERIFERLGIGVTSIPKLLYEDIPFLIGTKLQECAALSWRNDVCGVLCQPIPIVRGKIRDGLFFLSRVRFRALRIETSPRSTILRWTTGYICPADALQRYTGNRLVLLR